MLGFPELNTFAHTFKLWGTLAVSGCLVLGLYRYFNKYHSSTEKTESEEGTEASPNDDVPMNHVNVDDTQPLPYSEEDEPSENNES